MNSQGFTNQKILRSFAKFLDIQYKLPLLQFFQPVPKAPIMWEFSHSPASLVTFLDIRSCYFDVWPYLFSAEHLKLSYFVTHLSGHAMEWAKGMWEIDSPCFISEVQFSATRRKTFSSSASPPGSSSPSSVLRAGNCTPSPAVQIHVCSPRSTGAGQLAHVLRHFLAGDRPSPSPSRHTVSSPLAPLRFLSPPVAPRALPNASIGSPSSPQHLQWSPRAPHRILLLLCTPRQILWSASSGSVSRGSRESVSSGSSSCSFRGPASSKSASGGSRGLVSSGSRALLIQ